MQPFHTPSTSTHLSRAPAAVDELISKYSSKSSIHVNATSPSPMPRTPSRNPLQRVVDRVRLEYYRYEVTFGLYVMTPSEKLVANTFVFVVMSLLLWALLLCFPQLLYQKLSRLVWLLTGHSGNDVATVLGMLDKDGNPISPVSIVDNA